MPKVNGKKFPYTKAGKKAAQKAREDFEGYHMSRGRKGWKKDGGRGSKLSVALGKKQY